MNLELEEQIESIKYFLNYYKENCHSKMKVMWLADSYRQYIDQVQLLFQRLGYEIYREELFNKSGETIIDLVIKL